MENAPINGLTFSEKLISVFVILNVATVLFMNRPTAVVALAEKIRQGLPSAQLQYRFDQAGWAIRWYAHKSGLDATWQMFGRQSRFNWWYRIYAHYSDGRRVELPLPLQSPRTLTQRYFHDFREGKYYLNLYGSADLRNRYAQYLCRQFPYSGPSRVRSISFELHTQMLFEPPQTLQHRTHHNGPPQSRLLDTFACQALR